MEVERLAHAKRLPLLGEVEVRHLAQRVHAGVGAASAAHARRLAAEAEQRILERALHGRRHAAWRCQPRNGVPSYSMSDAVAGHGGLE